MPIESFLEKLKKDKALGKKVVIAKNNRPLMNLVAHKPEGKRKLGLLAGKFTVPDNIMEEDAEINSMFYGNDT